MKIPVCQKCNFYDYQCIVQVHWRPTIRGLVGEPKIDEIYHLCWDCYHDLELPSD